MSHLRESSSRATSRATRVLAGLLPGLLAAAPVRAALAAEVRGVVSIAAEPARVADLGYVRTRVAVAAPAYRSPASETAVFLRVKESLPLPPPSAKWAVRFTGLRLAPAVMACAIDESLVLTNDEKTPITVTVGAETLQPIAPGASLTYLCQQAGWQKVRVAEWPHVRAELFVGEVGVVAVPGADGKFVMNVPQGTYTLEVVSVGGGRIEVPVTVGTTNVDLGRLEANNNPADGTSPAPGAPASAARAAASASPAPASAAPASASPAPTSASPAPAATPSAAPASAVPAAPKPPAKPKPKASAPSADDEIDLEP